MLVTAWRGKLNTVGGAVRRCSHCGQYVNPIKHWVWMAVWSSNCPTPFSAKTHAIIVSSRYWLCPAYCSIVHTNQDVQTPSIPNNASRCRSRSRRSAGEASVVVLHMKLPPATLASHMCTISCPCSSTSDPGSLLVYLGGTRRVVRSWAPAAMWEKAPISWHQSIPVLAIAAMRSEPVGGRSLFLYVVHYPSVTLTFK